MSLVIPDEVVKASGLSEADLMLEIIIMLFEQKKISIGKASYLAKMPLIEFQHELAQRQIPIHYDVLDFEADMKTLEEMGRL